MAALIIYRVYKNRGRYQLQVDNDMKIERFGSTNSESYSSSKLVLKFWKIGVSLKQFQWVGTMSQTSQGNLLLITLTRALTPSNSCQWTFTTFTCKWSMFTVENVVEKNQDGVFA